MKNKNKKKTSMKMGIIVAILLLAVGFAAVSTVLVINGTIKITPDREDFENNVVFTDVSAEKKGGPTTESSIPSASTTEDDKKIIFTTQVMKNIGETSILHYKIKNESQYAAKITGIECSRTTEPNDDHIKIENDNITGTIIKPNQESDSKTVTVTMIKSYVGEEEKQLTFTCSINVDAQEATTE